ncbi:CLUMA_CG001339, isoform A [Clunio marinus]|uniref:CLUMA_CG001339, isoform A n=1 Tax=Clunio marinus TaxID=568069 RepID=A0A1J1HM64_9DIPT|nr:CLUMA_CG001339, isoform A [Clunio marinus]
MNENNIVPFRSRFKPNNLSPISTMIINTFTQISTVPLCSWQASKRQTMRSKSYCCTEAESTNKI